MEPNYEFNINVDNIEDVWHQMTEKRTADGCIIIRYSDDFTFCEAKPEDRGVFLTDDISIYYFPIESVSKDWFTTPSAANLKNRGSPFFNSLIKDKRLKHLQLSLYDDCNHDALFQFVKEILVANPNLQTVKLNTSHSNSRTTKNFSENQCTVFCEGLRRTKSLKRLIIEDRERLDQKKIQMLAAAINDNKNINLDLVLNIRNKELTELLLTSLKNNQTIRSICHHSDFSNSLPEWNKIKEFFQENSSIRQFAIKSFQYFDADVDPMMEALQASTTLQELELPISSYKIQGASYAEIKKQFSDRIFPRFIDSVFSRQNSSKLRSLKIGHLSDIDFETLFKALQENSTLADLQLGGIDVEDDPHRMEYWGSLPTKETTINAVNQLLRHNKTLKELRLNGMVGSDADLEKFKNYSVDWYKHNKTLEKLDLQANNLVNVIVGDALSHSKTLKSFKCTVHFTSPELSQILMKNTNLEEIYVTDFYAPGNYSQNFIKQNRTVRKFSSIFYDDGDLFLEELSNHPSITSFVIGRFAHGSTPDFSGSGIAALKKNWNLIHLDLNSHYNVFVEPVLVRNRLFRVSLAFVMHNIVRQKQTIFPMDIWHLIFAHLTPDLSIFSKPNNFD